MSHKFEVEYAKSGRAACKHCKTKIEKDALRFGYSQDVPAGEDGTKNYAMAGTKWYHFECFPSFKGARWMKANLPELDGESGLSGYDNLSAADQEKVKALWEQMKAGNVDAGGLKRPADTDTGDLQAALQNQGVLTDEQMGSITKIKEENQKKNLAQLKAMLKANNLPVSGTKPELLERVAENKTLGVLPVCNTCEKGKLKFNRRDGKITCSGYFDEAAGRLMRCKGPENQEQLERSAWTDDIFG